MDFTAFFYTYSTIAQTLAGAMGFLAAVVLYQMQHVTGVILPNLEKERTRVRLMLQDGGPKIAQHLGTAWTEDYHEIGRNILREWHQLAEIKARMMQSLYLTVGVIAVSIGAIPITPALGQGLGLFTAYVPLVLVVPGSFACLASYVRLVRTVITPAQGPRAGELTERPTAVSDLGRTGP